MNSTINGRTVNNLFQLAPSIAHMIHAPVKDITNIIKGNLSPLYRLNREYVKQVTKNKYNYVWVLRYQHHMSNMTLAKKLHVTYDDVCWIQKSKRPQISTVASIAKIFNISPITLGHKLNYSTKKIKQTIKGISNGSFGHFLMILRKHNHLSQKDVAKKLDMRQSNISRIEQTGTPQLETLLKMANLYNISLLKLLNKHPSYRHLQKNSPSFKLIHLCLIKHLSLSDLKKITDCPNINHQVIHNQSENDSLPDDIATKLINYLHLNKNYFGKTTNKYKRVFLKYKKQSSLNPSDFGYQLQYLRCKNHMTLTDLGRKLHVTNSRAQQLVYSKQVSNRIKTEINSIFNVSIK